MASEQSTLVLHECLSLLKEGQSCALVVLTRIWGSTPREVGAKMVVRQDGSLLGTIGGGCGEGEVLELTREELNSSQRNLYIHIDLTDDIFSSSGKVCGGRMDVLVSMLQPGDKALIEALSQVLERWGSLAWSLPKPSRVDWRHPPESWERWVFSEEGHRFGSLAEFLIEDERKVPEFDEQHRLFWDPIPPPKYFVIAGGGHIAIPLAQMSLILGYKVVVVDDRAEFVSPERFPGCTTVESDFFEYFSEDVPQGDTSIILVTRGHKYDERCLEALAGRSLTYLGMIGSRRRVKATFVGLADKGVDAEWLDSVRAPVGLDIEALTPEEISVSILAEMILLRRGGDGSPLSGK